MLATFVTVPIIARQFGAASLGAWTLIVSGGLLLALSDLGWSTTVRRAVLAGNDGHAFRALKRALFTAMCVGATLVPIAKFLIGDVDQILGAVTATWILLSAYWLLALTLPIISYVISYGGLVRLAWLGGLSSFVQIGMTILLLSYVDGLIAPALGVLAAGLIEFIGACIFASAYWSPPTAPGVSNDLSGDLVDSSAAFSIDLTTYLFSRLDTIVLSRFTSLTVVASYAVAARMVDQAFILAKQVSTGVLPKLRARERREHTLEVGTLLITGLVGPGMVALGILGSPLLVLWAGEAGGTRVTFLTTLILGSAAVVFAFAEVACSLLVHTQRTAWYGAIPVLVGGLVNVALTLVLTPLMGFLGAGLATVVSAMVTVTMVWQRVVVSKSLSRARVFRLVVHAMIGIGVAVMIALAARALPISHTVLHALIASAFTTLGGLLAVLTSAQRDRGLVKGRWRGVPFSSQEIS